MTTAVEVTNLIERLTKSGREVLTSEWPTLRRFTVRAWVKGSDLPAMIECTSKTLHSALTDAIELADAEDNRCQSR